MRAFAKCWGADKSRLGFDGCAGPRCGGSMACCHPSPRWITQAGPAPRPRIGVLSSCARAGIPPSACPRCACGHAPFRRRAVSGTLVPDRSGCPLSLLAPVNGMSALPAEWCAFARDPGCVQDPGHETAAIWLGAEAAAGVRLAGGGGHEVGRAEVSVTFQVAGRPGRRVRIGRRIDGLALVAGLVAGEPVRDAIAGVPRLLLRHITPAVVPAPPLVLGDLVDA